MPGARPLNRTIIALDIEAYSGGHRTDPIRVRLRRLLRGWCWMLLTRSGLRRDQWDQSDTGDGLLLSIDPHLPRDVLLTSMIAGLPGILARHNRRRADGERLRLRLAVHAGDVVSDPRPLVGEAVNDACRLLDSATLRACLRATGQPLVVVASQAIYDGIIKHAYLDLDPYTWHRVQAVTKEGSLPGWVHVPGDTDAPHRAGVVVVEAGPGQPAAAPPRELPPDLRDFTGRKEELARLDAVLEGAASGHASAAAIAAIDGFGGVGKSALAIHAAHRHAGRFRDGQLYLDLQGNTVGLAPMSPLQALGELLTSLGDDPRQVPTGLVQAANRFRSLTASRRLLIVLDNARDTDQIRPLLPTGGNCAVLITSRARLAFADGVTRITLEELNEDEAVELLGRLAGRERVRAEPDAARRVVHACGLLPLAVLISGQRLATRPTWTIAEYADRLARTRDRLSQFAFGKLQVRSSFQVSYEVLLEEDPDAARALRLLSLMDGLDFAQPVAEALLDEPDWRVEGILDRLVDANLLQALPAARYRFHDLLREFAREHARREDPPPVRAAAVARALGFYLATAKRTFTLLRPGDPRFTAAAEDPEAAAPVGLAFASDNEALAWLEAERSNLAAAIEQAATAERVSHQTACQLTSALLGFFLVHSHHTEWLQANLTALRVAERAGDRAAAAVALHDLARMYRRVGQYPQAEKHMTRSLELRRQLGDRYGEAACLSNLGVLHQRQGRYEQASRCYSDSLRITRAIGDSHGHAITLNRLSVVHQRLGHYDEALGTLGKSLEIRRELGDRHGQADVLSNQGVVYQRLGRYQGALAVLSECLDLYQQLGDRHGEADTRTQLGGLLKRLGREAEGLWNLREARRLYRELGHRHGYANAVSAIGVIYVEEGRSQRAAELQREALRIFRELEDPHYEAAALNRLGAACQLQERLDDARRLMEAALAIRERLGDRHGEADVLNGLGSVHRQRGELDLARARLLRSVVIYRQLRSPFGQAVALRRLGRLELARGRPHAAAVRLRYALRLFTGLGVPEATEIRHLLATRLTPPAA